MIVREKRKEIAIPATAIEGKVLAEVKKIGEEVKAAGESKEERVVC